MTDDQMKAWIDGASYEALLSKWRFAPVGDSILSGDIGLYFSEVMKKRRSEISDAEAAAASKRVGW